MTPFRISSLMTLVAAMLLLAGGAKAQQKWSIEKLDPSAYPAEIVTETRPIMDGGLPDGLLATAAADDIRKAWFSQPTERYRHAILGDAIEAGTLNVETDRGKRMRVVLDASEVFEDRVPRIADLDGNGTNEVVVIRSSLRKGGSVTVYGLKGNSLVQKATTGFIGRSNRWLNIAAIAPMTGTKANEIAFVSTPHIGGTLYVVRYAGDKLISLGGEKGFSNHVIGSTEMRLSAVADIDGNGRADIALPSANRKTLRIMGLKRSGLGQLASAALPSPIDKAIGLQKTGKKGFIVGLENGDVYLVHP
jgi:hypothetical protein